MDDKVLKTSADDLYDLVESRKKISIEDAAKILRIPANTVRALVDFFVEEKILGIEYKFTTPYVYISQKNLKDRGRKDDSFTKSLITKEEFFEKAKRWKISYEKINDLWKKYIDENISKIKKEFYSKAELRNLSKSQIDNLWIKYVTYLR